MKKIWVVWRGQKALKPFSSLKEAKKFVYSLNINDVFFIGDFKVSIGRSDLNKLGKTV